ncbi:MAG: chemotaxis response regulator protein-glutamate methylesterase [Lachnospiraceae bacterium]
MGKIRVLVVEDSMLFRELLVRNLNEDPGIEVVAVATDPFEARDKIIQFKPDVMTLDIELPRMSGLEFLQKLMPQYPIRTVVVSTLSEKVFDAIRAGAVDFVAKPHVTERSKLEEFVKNELPSKVKIAAAASLKTKKMVQQVNYQPPGALTQVNSVKKGSPPGNVTDVRGDFGQTNGNSIIAIGASTGGTEATVAVLKGFGPDLPGVVITQHMPAGFTTMYAERLDQRAGLQIHVKEAQTGDIIRPGHVFLAPGGDRHMKITKVNGEYQVVLQKADKVNGHCPSVDVLFHSVAEVAGKNSVGIILTGMGGDGAKGLLAMRQAGARTIGQNEKSCVVYGMPKVAYEMGAVEYQEDITDIARRTYSLVGQIQRSQK